MDKARLQERYETKVIPALEKELGVANRHAVPRLTKVVLNVGSGKSTRDPKALDVAAQTLAAISGQKPVRTKARKSISNFKLRQGMDIGVMITLRGRRMYEFLDKLINVTLPRVRDFQGLKRTSFDGKGNYTVAFREHNVFPEISGENMDALHGLEVTICTSASSPLEAEALLRALGFPLQQPTSTN